MFSVDFQLWPFPFLSLFPFSFPLFLLKPINNFQLYIVFPLIYWYLRLSIIMIINTYRENMGGSYHHCFQTNSYVFVITIYVLISSTNIAECFSFFFWGFKARWSANNWVAYVVFARACVWFRLQRAFFIGCGLWLDDKLINTSELNRHLSIPWSLTLQDLIVLPTKFFC
jgi:hypothetical protein